MDSRTEERVTDWDSRPFDGGYDRLRELADDEFSGVVRAAGTSLFMLNGRVVGVTDGDLDAFEDASGTIHDAPHPSLPLLFAMRERGGEERAQYYTNDTPISQANDTLSSGSFTGFIELSENVLSGDYYVVYYGGRSMSCAFVGNQEQLLTGDEAFERADDEVGIYTVWDVDIEVTDIPEPETDDEDDTAAGVATGGATGAGTGAGAGAGSATADDDSASDDGGATAVADADDASRSDDVDGNESTTASPDGDSAAVADAEGGAVGDEGTTADDGARSVDTGTESPASDDSRSNDSRSNDPRSDDPRSDDPRSDDPRSDDARDTAGASRTKGRNRRQSDRPGANASDDAGGRRSSSGANSGSSADARSSASTTGAGGDDAESTVNGGAMADVPDEVIEEVEDEAPSSDLAAEEEWRETTTIPSINPDRTSSSDGDPLAAGGSETTASTGGPNQSTGQRTGGNPRSTPSRSTSGGDQSAGTAGSTGSGERGQSSHGGRSRTDARNAGTGQGGSSRAESEESGERVAELESELSSVREERDSLEAERDELQAERDELDEENDELQERVSELEAEIGDLESELAAMEDRLADASGVVTEDTVELSPEEALAGTNLFVRYGSKSATTMDDVHDSDVTVGDLEANLRLEYHTGFDAKNAVVDGRPFDEFLYDSIAYGFVEWFVYDLVFEIRDTGNEKALGDLYEAFPNVDRIELQGEVSLRYDESGEEHREQTTFDVVVRDRMGNPLAVAAVNDRRDAATEDQMLDLQERAERVKRTSDSLAGAFMVTSSYFEPGALEVAEEATSGSILSRDSKESYVKLSRKQGYHLCLVETRNNEFHVNVPEL
jgi:hypothetical protein